MLNNGSYTMACFFWILTTINMKFGQILVYLRAKIDTIRAFFLKFAHFFFNFYKITGEACPCSTPRLVARLWVWVNMHQYFWIFLNIFENACIMFWIYQGFKYIWSSCKLHRILEMPQVLNVSEFWMWHDCI